MLGKPVAHSLSPVIHSAGYAAAGLAGWVYTAIECTETELAPLVADLDQTWAGLSLTMPLKEVALEVAAAASPLAEAIGAANTLVHRPDGSWYADNTDAPGMVDALVEVGLGAVAEVAILGAGGTARAAVAAAAQVGAARVSVYARRYGAGAALAPIAATLGIGLVVLPWHDAHAARHAPLVISTVPEGVADELAGGPWDPGAVMLDVVYDPWPTPLAAAAKEAGVRVVSGLDLLLAQAVRQFELFTGIRPAPVTQMRDAVRTARG